MIYGKCFPLTAEEMFMNERLPRLAASSYLNSAPLIWSFMRGAMKDLVTLTDPVPSKCADLLAEGAVDVALVPVIEYQRIAGIHLIPGVCVGSKERVRSVVLVTRTSDLKSVTSVALDDSSRTSATLVKIIFREFLGIKPSWQTAVPDLGKMLAANDGALIIGDPGMTFSRAGYHVWDLATLWKQFTGLGFVFAMWMMRDDLANGALSLDFERARDEGLANLNEIVDYYEKLLPLSRAEILDYLTDNISFTPNATMQQGMGLYFELAYRHGLIEAVKPLRFSAGE
jgi:chorismate dehydratase